MGSTVLGEDWDRRVAISTADHTAEARCGFGVAEFVGTSEQTARILLEVGDLIRSGRSRNVLITGETGVGKGVVASALHRYGSRRNGSFVRIDLAAVQEQLAESELFGCVPGAFTGAIARSGIIEDAHGGVLFLDEIGTASLSLQSKLLTVVEDKRIRRVGSSQDRSVDTWIIAATNEDLDRAMEEGLFRRDLYHRLCAREIRIPPLRERPDDIAAIARHLVRELAQETGRREPFLAHDLLQLLAAQPWPGNVRELEAILDRLMVISDAEVLDARTVEAAISRDRAVPHGCSDTSWSSTCREFQTRYLEWAVARWGPYAADVADALQISRTYVYRLCRRHGVELGAQIVRSTHACRQQGL